MKPHDRIVSAFRGGALFASFLVAGCAPTHAPLHGTPVDPPRPAPGFELTDQTGHPFALASVRGSGVLLYFGFTHCTDVCPQTLALLGKARSRAGISPEKARIIMVTVDPRRDTPAALAAFFKKAGVQGIGLTGSPQALQRVYRDYGIFAQQNGRDIAHTDRIFLIGPDARLHELLDPHTAADAIAQDLRAVVE